MLTYQGSCHCGNIRFEVDMNLDHVRVCDCSICQKRGALNHRVEDAQLRIDGSLEQMSLYEWHTKTAKDYFCPECGILPFRRPRDTQGIWAVNVRCLENVDLDLIPRKNIHGSELS
ncbi:MAG: GFA family protein [Gammaproteobacteria bacterium]|nr:GFA family protein [Gammaproteobacteria bacterium]